MTKPGKNLIRLPAASAHIWTKCGGSRKIRHAKSPFDDKFHAERGNMAHAMAALRLAPQAEKRVKVTGLTFKQQQIYLREKDEIDEMADTMRSTVLEHLKEIRSEDRTAKLYIEEPMTYTGKRVLISGPPDTMIVARRANIVHVHDLKSGFKVVEADDNEQLQVYGHGAVSHFSLKNTSKNPVQLRGSIVQPALGQTLTDGYFFDDRFFERIEEHFDPDKFVVGTHCADCAVKTVCKKFRAELKKFLRPEYADYTIARDADYPELLAMAKPAIKFFEEVHSGAFAYLQVGGKIPKWQIGRRGGHRAWNQGTTVEKLIQKLKLRRTEVMLEKMKSPAKVEELLKRKVDKTKRLEIFHGLCYKPEVPTLQPVVDKSKSLFKKKLKGEKEDDSKTGRQSNKGRTGNSKAAARKSERRERRGFW